MLAIFNHETEHKSYCEIVEFDDLLVSYLFFTSTLLLIYFHSSLSILSFILLCFVYLCTLFFFLVYFHSLKLFLTFCRMVVRKQVRKVLKNFMKISQELLRDIFNGFILLKLHEDYFKKYFFFSTC